MDEYAWLVLSVVLLAGHLAAMNVAAAGPLIAAWMTGGQPADGNAAHRLGRRLAEVALAALVVGAVLGGALILFPGSQLRAALARFPMAAYAFAGLELLFSAACIAFQVVASRRQPVRRWLAWGLAVASSTNLLYHFPPWMTVIGKLAANPHWAGINVHEIDRSALLRLWIRPEVLAPWAHFVLASLAAAAIAALWLDNSGDEREATAQSSTFRRLAAVALVASLLQLPIGVWLLLVSERSARESMIGGNLTATCCFTAGVLAALMLLQTLSAMALGETARTMRRRAGWLLLAVVVLMAATLRASRLAERNAEAVLPDVTSAM